MVSAAGRIRVYLIQQGIWEMPLESMPLASGYLKATALADEELRNLLDIQIVNFRGGVTLPAMASRLFAGGAPDILACSVLGWNYRAFGALAETFKQLNPDGLVIFGGTHVANQAARVFRMNPDVDVVVNGEGEFVFADLMRAHVSGRTRHDLDTIEGISFRDADDSIVTTLPRSPIESLDSIPSPTLTGALDLVDDTGLFKYDVGLMETNRGCPYKCSFCYWGGAVGQRVRAFSRERLRQELELFASLRVHTIALCDANFGLLPIDEEFVDDLIRIREQYGYPRALESSWAKNKSRVFYSIVRKMKQAGLRSSFTLALQTLSLDTLTEMNRRNMKVNEWEDLVEWLGKEGLDCYGELIWGAPGETVDSFLDGYDRLARHVSRIAVYPLLLLPNTNYVEKRSQYGIISVRGDSDDFEYVLAHNTMSFEDNQRMQRFLFWSRVMADAAVLRHSWLALRVLGGMSQSQVLQRLDEWVLSSEDAQAEVLRGIATFGTAAPGPAIQYFHTDPNAKDLLRHWWRERVRPSLPAAAAPVLDEIFRFDLLTQPVCERTDPDGGASLLVERIAGQDYYHRADILLRYDVPAILRALRAGQTPDLNPEPTNLDLYYRVGVEVYANTTNSEEIVYFMGMTRGEIAALSATGEGARVAALFRDGSCA
jgi:radical SAM C-methyltransferase